MADIHIDEFYHDCAKVLVQLYSAFPRQNALFVDDIITPEPVDEFGLPSRRHQACFDAFLWLAHEGYIRYTDRIRMDGLDQVVLTEKSFLRLSTPMLADGEESLLPSTVSRRQSALGWQLRQALKSGSTGQINPLCLQFFQA